MPEENLTNNSNPLPAPAQAEIEPVKEAALEPIKQPAPASSEVKIDFKPAEQTAEKEQPAASDVRQSENQQSENSQIEEGAPKLEEIEKIGEPGQSTETTEPKAQDAILIESNRHSEITEPAQIAEPQESTKSQQDLDKLSEQMTPPEHSIVLTEEQKRSFWQKVMHRLGQLSRKKRQNRWQMQRLAILKLLAQKGRIKNDDVEQALGAAHRTASYYLKKMQKEMLIERHNVKKKTFYILTPQGQAMLNSQT